MMSKVKALTPSRVKPSLRMESTRTPRKAPTIVPRPPISEVPPMTAPAAAANMIRVPPASGSMDVMRNPSSIPAKPPKTLHSMKLPILTLLTLTPVSLAPSRLLPVATVCRPHLVKESTICITITIAIAQMISEYGLLPNTWLKAPTFGVRAGKPLEMVRVMPSNRKRVPSVVMKDGTFSSTVTRPLNSPTAALASRPKMIAKEHNERGKCKDHAGREVDLTTDQQHDFASGNDSCCCGELGDRADVVLR